jgi:glucose/arabinose dehydrogenase
MYYKLNRLGMLALVLALSAAAAAQTSGPPPANAFAQDNASPQNSPQYNPLTPRDASPQTNARPTPAQLDQPGAVVTPPPILRNTGKTVAQPDQPLMGHLNLRGQRPQGSLSEQVPAMPPSPNEAATSSNADNAGAPRLGYD